MQCYDGRRGDILDRMSRTDLQTYLHELLMKQDQMSMAASIESRVPFLDDRLVEHVAALPSDLKVRMWQTKAIFREAVRDIIPAEILTRKKMGFPVPVGALAARRFLAGRAGVRARPARDEPRVSSIARRLRAWPTNTGRAAASTAIGCGCW